MRQRAERIVATVWWKFFSDANNFPSVADVLRDRMGVSRDDSPVPMSLEDVLRIRVKQLVWLDEAGEPELLNELVRRLAKELITDELRRKTGLNGAKRMQERR